MSKISAPVGGNAATSLFVSTTGNLITCNVPASTSPGAKNVVVTNGDQTQATAVGAFTYDPALSITTVSPPSGPSTGGTLLTIDGTSFTGNLTVMVGGQPAASVTVNTPAAAQNVHYGRYAISGSLPTGFSQSGRFVVFRT